MSAFLLYLQWPICIFNAAVNTKLPINHKLPDWDRGSMLRASTCFRGMKLLKGLLPQHFLRFLSQFIAIDMYYYCEKFQSVLKRRQKLWSKHLKEVWFFTLNDINFRKNLNLTQIEKAVRWTELLWRFNVLPKNSANLCRGFKMFWSRYQTLQK